MLVPGSRSNFNVLDWVRGRSLVRLAALRAASTASRRASSFCTSSSLKWRCENWMSHVGYEVAAAVGPVGRGLDVFTQDGAGYDVVRGAPVIMEMKRRNSAREACYTYGGVHRIQCVLL